ncbi:MAG: tRNA uridine-5-carboxymethylaminomethyl(34) synthesis GTPase MnmE [Calditrichaeota bacterium]|nr:MAG: tRNA uridine-5-carboxymethylaminomethyl(34) synthesis GTPase MnmE [Calditrichota bacterium]
MSGLDDTIAAIATPEGTGGIAVVRLSGPSAVEIADWIFEGKQSLKLVESHKACFGKIRVPEQGASDAVPAGFLDEAVVTVFRAPHSYTREDVVEIGCHGGRYLTHRVLELLLERGARLAEPGEFTQRAFLNGRLDLCQAEAVNDLIRAKTAQSLAAAAAQFQGALSRRVRTLRADLIEICSLLELELDFAEEDVEFAQREEVETKIEATISDLDAFLATYRRGKILREGAKVVLVGKPNVGKSSLLNALLKEERAIVTEVPGTTRDSLEEQLDIRGVLFRVVDTAGIRESADPVERIGVQRSLDHIATADVVVFLFDGTTPLGGADRDLVLRVFEVRNGDAGRGVIAAVNKIDLACVVQPEEVRTLVGVDPVLKISAKEHLGFQALESALLREGLGGEPVAVEGAVVTSLRQQQALRAARDGLQRALASLQAGMSAEFIALDLRQALDALGEIIGEVTTEDILGNIFSRFCIGK